MPTRVLLLAGELNLGGSERQLTEIARGLDRTRFEPHVGAFVPQGLRADELRRAGVPILHLPVHSLKSPAALRGAQRLARYVRERKIDIVHSFDYPMNVFAIPVVRYFTSALPVSSQRAHRDLTPPLHLRLLRQTDGMAAGIVVNCEFLRRHLMEDFKVPGDRIHLCYNGIDLEAFRAERHPQEELTVGVVCGLRPEKSLHTLLEAFALVGRGARLRIVGSGTELAGLQQRAADLGIAGQVCFQPATAEVQRVLGAIDIFVLPSRTEALSNALMEAMACGCACIASNVGGNPELIRREETGLLFEAGDAAALAAQLRRLFEDAPLRRRLAKVGQEFVCRNFSLAASARRMAEIYDDLQRQAM